MQDLDSCALFGVIIFSVTIRRNLSRCIGGVDFDVSK